MAPTTGRHRASRASSVGLLVIVALVGAVLGWGAGAITTHGSPSPPVVIPPPASAPPAPIAAQPSIARQVGPVAFAQPAASPSGLGVLVPPPEKVKGGVLLTVVVVNRTAAPMTLDTGTLGPHDPRFDGAAVPLSMTPVSKRLAPGEGYTYQCRLALPTMAAGQLQFALDSLTISGRAAGD